MLRSSGSKKSSHCGIGLLALEQIADRKLPGFDDAYSLLSEFAHPNWLGVVGLYSQHDEENFRTEFGRGLNDQRGSRLAHALALGLIAFERGYNKITYAMPAFLAELEKL